MKTLTGRKAHRLLKVGLGGFGRSQVTEIAVLELEERGAEGELSWRYAKHADLTKDQAG